VGVLTCRVEEIEDGRDTLKTPLGRPIANTRVFLLDSRLEPVPVGIPGELYVGGDSVTRGYLNQPALTAERFLPDPFSTVPSQRLYKTGDLVRYLADGNIEFLGRVDSQVKIRGFRIEPGEIEAVLGQHPAVRETAIMAREDVQGDKRLVGYVVPRKEQTVTIAELCGFLKSKLPEHMVPSVFVFLDALPLTPRSKVDRQALPEVGATRPGLEKGFVSPRTAAEKTLAGIWAQVLGLEQVGIYDNFFE
jgi:acyl-CoA synthetase (AMP-forming)/AMP-acid ligase II